MTNISIHFAIAFHASQNREKMRENGASNANCNAFEIIANIQMLIKKCSLLIINLFCT